LFDYVIIINYTEKHSKVFLDKLLALNEAGANFSNEELRDEVVTMMSAVIFYKKQ
jgi:cytochrome P450 family 4